MTWNQIWDSIVSFFTNQGLNILWAILAFILGYIVVRILLRIVKRILSKSKMEPITQGFIRSIIKVLLYTVLIFVVLQVLGVPLTGLITVLATAGVAISLSLKDSLSNVASGMVLISNKPFLQGDYVQIGGLEGTVKSIKIMTTELETTDGKKIVLSNSSVMNDQIVNFSATGKRRYELEFEIAYESDIDKAKDIILKVCESNGYLLTNPLPSVNLKFLKESSLVLFLTCWTDGPYWDGYFYIMDNVYNEFKRNNISVPYQQVEVRLREDDVVMPYRKEKLPKRVEIDRSKNNSVNIFEIGNFRNWDEKSKKRKMDNLVRKKQKLDAELSKLKNSTEKPIAQMLAVTNSALIKKKIRLNKAKVTFKFISALPNKI